MNSKKTLAKQILLFFGLIIVDQLSKYIIRRGGGFYICNSGIAFGMHLPLGIFYLLWSIIILGLLFAIRRNYFQPFGSFCLIIILSGAVANIIDRSYFGCVIDFIDLKFWPVFNLADIYISAGSLLVIWHVLSKKTPAS